MSFESPLPASCRIYLDFWSSIRGVSKCPDLADFLDQPDARIHPFLTIVDVDDPGNQTIRFAGTRVVDYFGKDLTRTNFLEILSSRARPIILEAHRQAPAVPCGVFHNAAASTTTGRAFRLHAMALPLQRSNGLPCVAWRLDPQESLGFVKSHIHVIDVLSWHWIDLGNGVPRDK